MRQVSILLIFASVACLAGESSLIDAIKDQDRKAVMALIQNHSDVNARDNRGRTALMEACHGGPWKLEPAEDIIQLLLSAFINQFKGRMGAADRKPAAANPAADDANLAAELWDHSAKMCGLESSAAG